MTDNHTYQDIDNAAIYRETGITETQVLKLLARGWRPPPVPPQYVDEETPGWVWATNRREAYRVLGPQVTPWGTLIQAAP